MKKKLLILILFFPFSFASAQKTTKYQRVSNHSIYIKGDDFEGVILDGSDITFTPTVDEIELTESILKTSIDTVKNRLQDFKKYTRQYWGYFNKDGQKIVFINMFCDGNIYRNKKYWLNKSVSVFDGGNLF